MNMTNRFNVKARDNFGVPGLQSGYDNKSHTSFVIPPVGLADVDRSLFSLFDKELPLFVTNDEGVKRVPVVFASGEKWAMLKKGKAWRDKQGSLVLPIITIGRNTIQQNPTSDISGRGVNQQTGEFVIKRSLANEDRDYQSLINKQLIKNQDNVLVNEQDSYEGQATTTRQIGESLEVSGLPLDASLASSRKRNVWEFFTLPTPQFYTAKYEITLWASYTTQMNEMIECLISSFLPQSNSWKLTTQKGYWFLATVDGNIFSSDNNFEDMSADERLVKYKFDITVPAYILATTTPGAPVPVRRYVSRPEISFSVSDVPVENGTIDPYLGADDPTLPTTVGKSNRDDLRETGGTRLFDDGSNDVAMNSKVRGNDLPKYKKLTSFDKKGNPVERYVRVKKTNSQGETTYSSVNDLSDFSFIVNND